MRAVFHAPASITSVVEAPRAVSSEARPTRPLCAVNRAAMPAAWAAAVNRRPRLRGVRPPKTRAVGSTSAGRRAEDGGGGAVLEIAHVGGGALLVGLGAAHRHENRILGGGGHHVAPLEGGRFTAAESALEEHSGEGLVEGAAPGSGGGGFEASAGAAGTVSGGEDGGEAIGGQRRGLAPAPVGAVAPGTRPARDRSVALGSRSRPAWLGR